MRRLSVLACLFGLVAAAPAEARCRVVLEKGDLRVGRTAKGWGLCGRGVSFPATGRPVALDSRGRAVAVRFEAGERTLIRWVRLGGRYPARRTTVLGAGERFVRQAFAPGGLYVAVGGARPHIRRTGGEPSGVIDRTRGIAPRSLRRRGEVVEWRIRGELRRISAIGGRDVRPEGCRVPAFAVNVSRAGRAVTFELRLGDLGYEGAVYGCLQGGRPHKVGETSDGLLIEEHRTLLLREPFGLFERTSAWKDTSREVVAVDLRTGATTAREGVYGDLVQAVVSPTGAVAFSQRHAGGQEIVTVRGVDPQTLDSGPAVDGATLALDGTTLSWTSGGERRTAELP